jgi:hypothetical protein
MPLADAGRGCAQRAGRRGSSWSRSRSGWPECASSAAGPVLRGSPGGVGWHGDRRQLVSRAA